MTQSNKPNASHQQEGDQNEIVKRIHQSDQERGYQPLVKKPPPKPPTQGDGTKKGRWWQFLWKEGT